MDIIFIRELHITTIIGTYLWERDTYQILLIDLELGTDTIPASITDKLEDTIDYQAVARRVKEFAVSTMFRLLETLAERIVEMLRLEFSIPWIRLTLRKPDAVPCAYEVGITIERGKRS